MKTVLIADDSKFMREWLKSILQQHYYEVVAEAEDGQEAIDLYKQYSPDIVLLDITMPKVNGLKALEEIIKYDSNANVYICSAIGTKTNVILALQSGARDFIVKPNFNNLIEVLEGYTLKSILIKEF